MSASEGTRGGSVNNLLSGLLILLAIIVTLAIGAQALLPGVQITPPSIIIATADVAKPVARPAQPAQTGIDAYNATAQAQWSAAQPAQNVDQLPVDAPLPQYVEKEAPDREPASAGVVPTSEPIVQSESSGIFGSKSKPVNIQETHQCKHGQIWVDDRGCKNPTPTR